MYKERINAIQEYLKSKNIDAYITFICDDHGSEYVLDTYKTIAFLCGFSGSAGTLIITKNNSYLWVDGRYFLQAKEQIKESNTIMQRLGIDISINDFCKQNVNSLVLDFKVASVLFVKELLEVKPEIKLYDDKITNLIWKDRPNLPNDKIFILPEKYFPINGNSKCHKTIKSINSKKDFAILVSALDDIAYLLNARGLDIPYNPVFYSFMLLIKEKGQEKYILYINPKKVSKDVKTYLSSLNIKLKPYGKVYEDISKIKDTIYYDSRKTNYMIYSLMNKKEDRTLWPSLAKAIKSSVEIKETKKAHIKDGIAMTKFMYYVKTKVGKIDLDEISAANYLYKLRRKQGAFDLSFATICGYKEHGAIIHYGATKQTNVAIKKDGFLLVDSGGQYFFGTTDITRTFALANISEEMKYHFTLVLKSHIDLAMQNFAKGFTDKQLDAIARKPLNEVGLDYNHGTGHGIGHLLNVHEGPQSISTKKQLPVVMKKGMITSDEPGLYFEGKYGIRHENEILCVNKGKGILGFEPITYVPFDLDAIDSNLLNKDEINWLNNYHKMVYEKLNKYLTNKERKFLLNATREIN